MGGARISVRKYAALALLILAVSVSAIIIVDTSSDSSADDTETHWYVNGIKYTLIEDTFNLRVDGPIDTLKSTMISAEIRESMILDYVTYYPTEIAPSAFKDCTALTSIKISKNISSIGDHAFYGCILLESIVLPDTRIDVYDYAFAHSGIRTAEIPGETYYLAPHIFENCINLETVKLHHDVTTVSAYAFKNCSSLENIEIPSVNKIGEEAFSGCTSLKKIELPDTLTSFGSAVFRNCTSLEEMTIPTSVSGISDSMFEGCTSLRKVTMYDNIESIGTYAFAGCILLSEMPQDLFVRSVGSHSFQGCTSMTCVRLTSDARYVGDHAFDSCGKITLVTMPSTVMTLGESVFGNTIFYDSDGKVITDQNKLPGYSYELKDGKLTRCDACFYVISFDVDGGSVPIADKNENVGSAFVIGEYEGVKEGMTFTGWECEGVDYKIGDMFVMPGHSVQMTMIWEKYVSPQDSSLLAENTLKFIAWAFISIVFVLLIVSAAMIIIYKRRS